MTRLKVVVMLFLLVALVGLPAYAQAPTTTARTVVNIPFAFVAGEVTLPPGDYTILAVSRNVLQFIGPNGSDYVFTGDVYPSSVFETSQLVFAKQGDTMVLHQVIPAGYSQGFDLSHATRVPNP